MRGIVGLFVVGLLAAGVTIYFSKKMSEDPGQLTAIAFGEPHAGEMEFHVAVDLGTVQSEGPKLMPNGVPLWDQWLEEKFDLRDESGTRVPFTRISQSALMKDIKVGGAPEFYLRAMVKPGVKYTFIYTKRIDEGLKYRHEFSAPTARTDMQRVNFEPMAPAKG